MSFRFVCISLTALAAVAMAESDAHALGPVDLEAGLKGGVATKPSDAGVTPYGIGLGLRAGVSIFNVYAGVSAIHYFGSSDTTAGVETSISSTLVGLEAGYTITAIPLLRLRPQVGFGVARYHYSIDGATGPSFSYPDHDDEFYVEPGVTVVVPLGVFYVGADANALIVPDGPDPAFSLHAQVGVHF